MVDAWESLQDEYQRTAVVLDHFNEEINGGPNGGVLLQDGTRKRVKIMLLAGGDLIQSMGEPGVWATADVSRASHLRPAERVLTDSLFFSTAAPHSRAVRVSDR